METGNGAQVLVVMPLLILEFSIQMNNRKKFDPDFKYIKKWIPEFGTKYYPKPIVEHKKSQRKV